MRARRIVLGIAAGLACFALGVVAARWLGGAAPPAPASGVSLFPADAGPRVLIDPDKIDIQLLPDASLRLDLLDAGAR